MSATNGAFFTEQFLKPTGAPYAGVRVFHYVAGNTTTNLDVYQNGDLTAPHNNPVDGDASGRVSFYGSGTYRLLVKSSTADGNLTLYDWDPVELIHHTATVRAEDRGLSLPSAYQAARGRFFGVTDTGGDILSMWYQRSASAWQQMLTPILAQMLQFAKGDTIASSSTITIPDNGNFFDVTGTNTIETMSAMTGYPIIYLRTLSALTFQHHSTNLRMLGAQDRLTIAGQITAFLHTGSGQWTELWYQHPFFGNGYFTDGAVLVGNEQGEMIDVPLPIAARTLGHIGFTGDDPTWVTGLNYHGPTAVGAPFTQGHEGNVTYSVNASLYGTHYYTNFTLNAGVTLTLPTGTKRLVIIASDSIAINGTISTIGAGGSAGQAGTDQPGGNGGGDSGSPGGSSVINGCVNAAPGSLVSGPITSLSMHPSSAMGGAGGGNGQHSGGAVGAGGTGGGSIVLIAPVVTLGAGAVLNTSGSTGATSADSSTDGGGGGAGNIYIVTRTYTNDGVTVVQAGGGAGTVFPFAGAGSPGVTEVLIFG